VASTGGEPDGSEVQARGPVQHGSVTGDRSADPEDHPRADGQEGGEVKATMIAAAWLILATASNLVVAFAKDFK
jgi:hypothetical protein